MKAILKDDPNEPSVEDDFCTHRLQDVWNGLSPNYEFEISDENDKACHLRLPDGTVWWVKKEHLIITDETPVEPF
jgi:hypothetical protein